MRLTRSNRCRLTAFTWRHAAWLAGVLLMSPSAWAAIEFAKTAAEEAMCQARIYAGRDTSDRDNWMHMHHYCDCLRFINRAYSARDRYDRKEALQLGIGGCEYVLGHTKSNFSMRPEIMTQKAIGLKMMGQRAQAAGELTRAIQFNPDYVPAYGELADYYREVGDKKKALELITEALKRAPESRRLQRRYQELGGKEPYPQPIARAKPVEEAEAAPPAKVKPEAKTDALPAASGQAATDSPSPPPATAPEPSKIGSPTNPYCRFCPDLGPPAQTAAPGK